MTPNHCLSTRTILGAILPNAGAPSTPAQRIAHPAPLPGLGAPGRADASSRH